MASTSINRTPASAGDMKKWTFSIWLKRAGIGAEQAIFSAYHSSDYYGYIRFNSDDTIEMFDYETTERYKLVTNRKFRDVGAWYHIVVNQDVENGTSGDRLKIWINGIRETSFSTANYPATTVTSRINNATPTQIGAYNSGSYFNGEMSHIQFVNAESLAPTEFGEVDATSGIWKIKTGAYATPGTNGFFLKMEDRTNLDLDSSSNAYTFTTTGDITATYDNPSNNFCTMNPLDAQSSNGAGINYANGNTHVTDGDSNWRSSWGTLGESVGKYYYEAKVLATSTNWGVGICDVDQVVKGETKFWATSDGYGTNASTQKCNSGAEDAWGGISIAQNDIVQCALDLDNAKIYFGKNGTWIDSGDPTSGATGTGAAFTINTGGRIYLPAWAGYGTAAIMAFNFGNGYFATTAISSEGTNASGIGSFEYDVPTGYTAWTTKGFNV